MTQVTHSPLSQTVRHGKTAADLYAHCIFFIL